METREERRLAIPQFTLRWLLGLTTVCAFLFAVLGMAARGHAWAIGISVGLGSILLLAMVHAMLFECVSIVSSILPPWRRNEGTSPFRTDPAVDPTPPDDETPIEAEIVA